MSVRKTLLLIAALVLIPSMALGAVTEDAFARWYDHIAYLTEEAGIRTVGSMGHDVAYYYLLEEYERIGMSYDDETLWKSGCIANGYDAFNIVGVKPALNENPRIITVCAHYDSISPGARDNASGVATVLLAMEYFQQLAPYPDTELRFIAFTGEESGHEGSLMYVENLTPDEKQRSLATFNVDILLVDAEDTQAAFSCDTLGMRTEDGYVSGTEASPAVNAGARAILAAMEETGLFDAGEEGVTWCVPRHLGASDHESFHLSGIDAVNVCFRGNVAEGGSWPGVMHTPEDVMGDFDLERSRQALEVLLTAVEGLAADPDYGA